MVYAENVYIFTENQFNKLKEKYSTELSNFEITEVEI